MKVLLFALSLSVSAFELVNVHYTFNRSLIMSAVSFLLVLHAVDSEDPKQGLDFFFCKSFSHQVLPREGECVLIGGWYPKVGPVYHNLLNGTIDVCCSCCMQEICFAYLTDITGWQIGSESAFRDYEDEFRELLYKKSGKRDFEFVFRED